MSETPGVGNYTAKLRRPSQKRQEKGGTPTSQPAHQAAKPISGGKPASAVHFSGLANAISSINTPAKLQDLFLATSKEGSTALLLPESSVIVGRSVTSYRRDGWLELQERLPEELTVAAIWLFGVDKLRQIFEKQIKPKVFKDFNHLSTDIAWNRAWGKAATVDLSPQEMFTKNSQEINALLKLKSVRWLFSVGLALTGVAYIIPKANQWKTNLILKHLGRRKRETEGSNVQFGDPNAQGAAGQPRTSGAAPFQGGTRTPQPFSTGFNPSITQTTQPYTATNSLASGTTNNQPSQPFRSATPYKRNNQFYQHQSYQQRFQGGNNSESQASQGRSQKHRGVQFGGLPGGSLIQGLGHLVEQTPYGSILVVDAGIAGGRSYVASKRSMFETAEVLFRDVGSLYFYILCAPHLMKLMGAGLDSAFKTSMGLQPKVAQELHKRILEDAKAQKTKLTRELVEKVLKGATGELGDTLMQPEGKLKQAMRSTQASTFGELLDRELAVYLKGKNSATSILETLKEKYLSPGTINTEQIQTLLTAVENNAKIPSDTRQNMMTAIKQAFRHSAGIPVNLGEEAIPHNIFEELINKLPPEEATALTQRIKRAAQLDSLNQTHSILRRSINVMHDVLGGQTKLLKRGVALADWIDEAVNRNLTIDEMAKLKPFGNGPIHAQIDDFMAAILQKTGERAPERELLQHYQTLITGMTRHNQGRLFSMATEQHDAALAQKLRAMLKGGLENDHQFLNKALELVGQLETDSRKFINSGKAAKMQEGITHYADALLNKLRSLEGKKLNQGLKGELERFFRLNQNLHYGSWTVALGTTMLCLGWLVPHLQTVLTKRLTGHDKHPGIASVDKDADAHDEKPAKPYTPALPLTTAYASPYTASYANNLTPSLRPVPNAYQRS